MRSSKITKRYININKLKNKIMNQIALKTNVGDSVIERVNSLVESGFTMPKDYNFVNAVKMSMLKLQDTKDKNGKSALDVCSKVSIQTALFQMCCKGLNAAYNQCYLIVRGDKLTLHESYFGKILMVKRIYPNWTPTPVVIREGDEFVYEICPETGFKKVVKHSQSLENIDKGFVGAYMYLPTGDLYLMTKKQIMTAWSKSASKEQMTHKQFDEKMISKTIVNSGCNVIINSQPEYQVSADEVGNLNDNEGIPEPQDLEYEDFEEVTEEYQESQDAQPQEPQQLQEPQVAEDDEF